MMYPFTQVLAVVAVFTNRSPDEHAALETQLRQWQKMGLPHGLSGDDYTLEMIWEVAIIAEMARLGIAPAIAGQGMFRILNAAMEATDKPLVLNLVPGSRSAIVLDTPRMAEIIEGCLATAH